MRGWEREKEREGEKGRKRETRDWRARERRGIAARIKRARYQCTLGRLRCRVEVSIRAKIYPRHVGGSVLRIIDGITTLVRRALSVGRRVVTAINRCAVCLR